ncbi:MAG: hypothetical protein GY855_15530 [candidate division Zixibacteria bacterium]|nr:hypothetical protein [candidate division Zixibacteria bacterium]
MSEERLKILNMLSEGKISVSEANELLKAVDSPSVGETGSTEAKTSKSLPKFLHVVVNGKEGHGKHGHGKVNVRVPLQLLRAGVKLASIMPKEAGDHVSEKLHDKGIDIDLKNVKPENIDEIIEALSDLTVDVDDEDEKVRIYCE